MSRENVEIVRRAAEAAAHKPKPDVATLNALFHTDHEFLSVTSRLEGHSYHGGRGFESFLTDIAETWESWESAIEEVIDGDEERVVVIAFFKGWMREGPPIRQRVGWVMTVRDGKVARTEGYSSREEALEAVGLRE